MAEDRWFRLLDDKLDDIPARIEQLKTSYRQRTTIFFMLMAVGLLVVGWAGSNDLIAIGCFIAVTGIVGVMALSTMCHTQLCLYRAIREMRQLTSNPKPEA
jgi:hypothetical protein